MTTRIFFQNPIQLHKLFKIERVQHVRTSQHMLFVTNGLPSQVTCPVVILLMFYHSFAVFVEKSSTGHTVTELQTVQCNAMYTCLCELHTRQLEFVTLGLVCCTNVTKYHCTKHFSYSTGSNTKRGQSDLIYPPRVG